MPIDDDTIVVPVPDTSKAAADAMAFQLERALVEGLIRNRYTGRTFIEGSGNRKRKAETKYTPLREVLEGKRVLLVEDSIVRSTTMKVLLQAHSRAGPGRERFTSAWPARRSSRRASTASTCRRSASCSRRSSCRKVGRTEEVQAEMAAELGADSLRYLPVESIARAIDRPADELARPASPATTRRRRAKALSDRAGQFRKRSSGRPEGSRTVRTYEAPAGRVR